jgi:RHS repeat-associated protein
MRSGRGGRAGRPVIKYAYDPVGNQIGSTDPRYLISSGSQLWAWSCTQHDGLDRATKSYTYLTSTGTDGCNWRNQDGSLTTTHSYGGAGTRQTDTAPDGSRTITMMDLLGETTSSGVWPSTANATPTTPVIAPTISGYDVFGNANQVTAPGQSAENLFYDAFGDLVLDNKPTDAPGAPVSQYHYHYNPLGQMYLSDGPRYLPDSSGVDDRVAYQFDLLGHIDTVSWKALQTPGSDFTDSFTFTYDDSGHMVQATSPLGTASLGYSTSGSGGVAERDWYFTTPASGSLGCANTPGANTGLLGASTIGTGSNQAGTCYGAYNSLAMPTTVTYEGTGGFTATNTYDNLGNLTAHSGSGSPSYAESFRSDEAGNTIYASSGSGSSAKLTTSSYDAFGRLASTSETIGSQAAATSTYSYDGSTLANTGHLVSVEDQRTSSYDSTTRFNYSDGGLLSWVKDPFTGSQTNYVYDTGGRITQRTDPAGLTWTRTYGANAAWITDQSVTDANDHVVQHSAYTYDLAGDVLTDNESVMSPASASGVVAGSGTTTYGYDYAGRVISSSGPGPDTTYLYDGSGNRVLQVVGTGGNAVSTTTTYDSRGLPLTAVDNASPHPTTTTYTYDGLGRMTDLVATTNGTTKHTTLGYDAWGRTISESQPAGGGSTSQAYVYDALGRMISSTPNSGAASSFTYEGASSIEITSSTSSAMTQVAYGPYGPLAQQKSGSGITSFFLKDLHGDVVGLDKSSSSTPLAAKSFDLWGSIQGSAQQSGATSPLLGFQGDPSLPGATTDAGGTPFVMTQTRVYDPLMGRFDSQDVLFGQETDPMSLNQYVYGGDSPVDNSDPTGMGGGPGHVSAHKDCPGGAVVPIGYPCPGGGTGTPDPGTSGGGGSTDGGDGNGTGGSPPNHGRGVVRNNTTDSTGWPPGCHELVFPTVEDWLSGRQCVPMGFFTHNAAGFGYFPNIYFNGNGDQRLGKPDPPGDGCSRPVWGPASSCYTHDYGWDLIRFGAIPPQEVFDVNQVLHDDIKSHCGGWNTAICNASAGATKFIVDAAGRHVFLGQPYFGDNPFFQPMIGS